MKSLLFLGLCIAIVFAAIDADVLKKLDQINNDKFGKTLFATIKVQLGSPEPLDSLMNNLSQIEDTYQSDQKEDDQTNGQFQENCDKDLADLQLDIATSERKQVELQGQLDTLRPVLSERQAQLNAKQGLLKTVQGEVDALDQQRQQENQEYENKRQEMQVVVQVINEAKRIFTGGNSFLQGNFKTESISQVNNHFQKVAIATGKQRFGKAFSHIFKFLASMTSSNRNQSPELVEKILHLCDQLLDKVDESWDTERKAEDQRVQVYNNYKKLLQKDINTYNTQIANLNTEISSLTDKINSVQASLDDTTQRISDKTTRSQDRKNECQEAAYDYQQRRQQRDNDRGVLSNLIGIVNTNLRSLKEYVALRTAAGDTFFGPQ